MMTAIIKGLSLTLNSKERKSIRATGFISGLSFLIVPKVLYVKVLRWTGAAYVPVPGVKFNVDLGEQVFEMVTGADGKVETDFEGLWLSATPDLATIPAGFTYRQEYWIDTKARNYLHVTLLPDTLNQSSHYMQIL